MFLYDLALFQKDPMHWLFPLVATISNTDLVNLVETRHHLSLNEPYLDLPYKAATGKFPVQFPNTSPFETSEEAQLPPEIFFIAYFVEGESDRPITFIFPGGPGGSCGPETICSIGPRRILSLSEGKSILPPYEIIDNPETLLPWTDLVFVDPVGTGFSTPGENPDHFSTLLSVDGDIAVLGNFVKTFIAYFNRWNSPKYLSGTSYGTTRCCGIAEYLTFHDLPLHGLILLGTCIDFSTIMGQHNRMLPDSLLIPTLAASAWYHGRFWPEKPLEDVIEYAKRFCFESYLPAMLQPGKLSSQAQDQLYTQMAELIGLPFETVKRYQGKFDERLYTTEFFALDRKVIGGLDTRYVGEAFCSRRNNMNDDPSYQEMRGLDCAFHNYLHNELESKSPFESYVTFSYPAFTFWDYSTYDSIDWPELTQRLKRTLITNPHMQVFVGSGYYDCRTPFAAAEYSFDHLDLPSSYQKNILFRYYEGGHGFIFDVKCLKKLKEDLVPLFTQK